MLTQFLRHLGAVEFTASLASAGLTTSQSDSVLSFSRNIHIFGTSVKELQTLVLKMRGEWIVFVACMAKGELFNTIPRRPKYRNLASFLGYCPPPEFGFSKNLHI